MGDKYKEAHDRFLRLEEDLELFSLKIDGVLIWERIRHSIHREVFEKSGLVGQAHTQSPLFQKSALRKYTRFAYRWIKSLLIKNPFLTSQHDILFFGHSRRKKRDDGYWWDIYCDPVTEETDMDYVHFEEWYQDSHRKPAKTGNLEYLDFIHDTGIMLKKLGFTKSSFSSLEERRIQKIKDAFESEFGVSIDFKKKVEHNLSKRKSRKWMYSKLIDRVDPQVVVIVVSYGKDAFIEACKDNGIPVVELQHGVIHKYHMAYHFPDEVDVPTFPDYLFTFGEYWRDCVNYPIDDDKVVPVGYPYLERESKKYADIEKSEQIIFISQGSIGEELSRFAIRLCELVDEYNIIYKLHPGEYDRWRENYPWLENAELRVVDSDEPPLYRLFAESKVQVGVSSTALYEGLNFGLDTYVMNLPRKDVMDYLIESGYATLVDSVDDLLSEIGINKDRTDADMEYIFKNDAVENALEVLNEIREKE